MTLVDLLEKIEVLLDNGDTDEALGLRHKLSQKCQDRPIESESGAIGRAQAADLHLMMLEKAEAVQMLSPYLIKDQNGPDEQALAKLPHGLPYAAVLSATANALYHMREYNSASRTAANACDHFEALYRTSSSDPRVIVGRLWTTAYAARIFARLTPLGQFAANYVSKFDRYIEEEHRNPRIKPLRLASVEGFALDFRAVDFWQRGKLSDAEAASYKALVAFGSAGLKDTPRGAHALLTAGRVQSTLASRDSYWNAFDLLKRAMEGFETVKHELEWLARLELVRLALRSEQLVLAETYLSGSPMPTDKVGIEAEYELTLCWLNARLDKPLEQEEHARNLLRLVGKGVSRRLDMEGRLQLAMALKAKAESDDDRTEILSDCIELLKNVEKDARHLGRERIETACLLELADVYRRMRKMEETYASLDKADTILPNITSAYLHQRRREIESVISQKWFFLVASENHPIEADRFHREFFTRALRRYETQARTAEKTFSAPNTVRKYVEQPGAIPGQEKDNDRGSSESAKETKGPPTKVENSVVSGKKVRVLDSTPPKRKSSSKKKRASRRNSPSTK